MSNQVFSSQYYGTKYAVIIPPEVGDILVGDGLQSFQSELSVGSDLQVLSCDSTAPLGLAYKDVQDVLPDPLRVNQILERTTDHGVYVENTKIEDAIGGAALVQIGNEFFANNASKLSLLARTDVNLYLGSDLAIPGVQSNPKLVMSRDVDKFATQMTMANTTGDFSISTGKSSGVTIPTISLKVAKAGTATFPVPSNLDDMPVFDEAQLNDCAIFGGGATAVRTAVNDVLVGDLSTMTTPLMKSRLSIKGEDTADNGYVSSWQLTTDSNPRALLLGMVDDNGHGRLVFSGYWNSSGLEIQGSEAGGVHQIYRGNSGGLFFASGSASVDVLAPEQIWFSTNSAGSTCVISPSATTTITSPTLNVSSTNSNFTGTTVTVSNTLTSRLCRFGTSIPVSPVGDESVIISGESGTYPHKSTMGFYTNGSSYPNINIIPRTAVLSDFNLHCYYDNTGTLKSSTSLGSYQISRKSLGGFAIKAGVANAGSNLTMTEAVQIDSLGQVVIPTNLYLATTGGTPSPLNYYEEYSATIAFSGPIASTNTTVYITRIGRVCTLTVLAFQATGISVSASLATAVNPIPSRFYPNTANSAISSTCRLVENTVNKLGVFQIYPTGKLEFFVETVSGSDIIYRSFNSNAGTNGLQLNHHITYNVL